MEEKNAKRLSRSLMEPSNLKILPNPSMPNRNSNLPSLTNSKLLPYRLTLLLHKSIRQIGFFKRSVIYEEGKVLSRSAYNLQRPNVGHCLGDKGGEKERRTRVKFHALLNSFVKNAKQEDRDIRFSYSSIISSNKYKVSIDYTNK
eukprot:TRINITY_DN11087_c0_g1_i12.p1 TRINITY_DN11087_c0_g1~~TRINITY_DN11087_c0_g1_i12.p1  ORF type:complete len:145 (+),score=18.27 TRINITY_DN11087_c0_g1_i12:149-583(+)